CARLWDTRSHVRKERPLFRSPRLRMGPCPSLSLVPFPRGLFHQILASFPPFTFFSLSRLNFRSILTYVSFQRHHTPLMTYVNIKIKISKIFLMIWLFGIYASTSLFMPMTVYQL